MKRLRGLLMPVLLMAVFTAVSVLSDDGLAQQRRPAPAVPAPAAKEEPAPEPPLAYEPELLRLAEVLGTLSYMTALCGQPGSDSWPQRMAQLIEAEGATLQRKERLAGAYNRGYLGHQPAHRTCTDRARLVIDRTALQGQRLTRELASRYAG
jgi:uncharacterized protein (TIGR02301 family)